jgi:hypothetical protein
MESAARRRLELVLKLVLGLVADRRYAVSLVNVSLS